MPESKDVSRQFQDKKQINCEYDWEFFFKTESDIPGANLYLTKSWDADRWILAREFQNKVTRLAPNVTQIAANRIPQDRQCLARKQERALSLQSRRPHDCLPMRAAPAFGTG